MEKKYYGEESIFLPENLLREARRQKNLKECPVPPVCILDPDGDILKYLKDEGATINTCWACYHSELFSARYNDLNFGIIGCAVGASYAVLLAEQLFVSGCKLFISVTSAGKLNEQIDKDYILIEESLRDEGTSYHYIPSHEAARLSPDLLKALQPLLSIDSLSIQFGRSWTTDAPYRETASSIENARTKGADCVEMEAAALYSFSKAKHMPVVCFAHVTNSMAVQNGDFEKGVGSGSLTSLELIYHATKLIDIK